MEQKKYEPEIMYVCKNSGFLPVKKSPHDAGYDLSSAENGIVPVWGSVLVNTDLTVKIPNGYYGRIASRSGLAVKNNIEVGAGVVDCNYTGLVKVLLRNFSDKVFEFKAGDRIAQLIVSPYTNVDILPIEDISSIQTDRQANGFGSSGV
jgi:dUTP pyrophosphatase